MGGVPSMQSTPNKDDGNGSRVSSTLFARSVLETTPPSYTTLVCRPER